MGYLLNHTNDFARRIGSKDKKKRNIQKAAGAVGGLAVAGAMGYAMNRYGLKQLGKTLNKKRPKLTGSSASNYRDKGGSLANANANATPVYTRPVKGKSSSGSSQKSLPPSTDPNVYNGYRKKLSAGKQSLAAGFDASPTRKSNIYRASNSNQSVNRGNALPQRTSKTRGRPIGSKNKDKSITESTNKGKSNKGKKNKGK